MPTVSIKKTQKSFQIEKGSNLMKSLLENGRPVASSCNGDGVCAKCRIQILSGSENLSAPNETELFLREKFQLKANERISCQTEILGDITVDATYW